MKTLYIIGGTMGVGKTAACRELQKMLPGNVFFDGDWAWDARPFVVNERTKALALGNIAFSLNSFLRCPDYENVIFCWVMHEQGVIDELLSRLEVSGCLVRVFSLVCDERALEERLAKDVKDGLREEDAIARSLARLPLYNKLDTIKIDVTALTARETARAIIERGGVTNSAQIKNGLS